MRCQNLCSSTNLVVLDASRRAALVMTTKARSAAMRSSTEVASPALVAAVLSMACAIVMSGSAGLVLMTSLTAWESASSMVSRWSST